MCPQPKIRIVENPGVAWYALYTRHQHEKNLAATLSRKGFETFLPVYVSARRWADRTKEISLPLFPCYVFVRCAFGGQELQVVTTPGVYDFVRSAGRAAMIPDSEIDAVQRMVKSSLRIEPHPFLKRGDWVRIRSGPIAGLEGILCRRKSVNRLVVTMELLERSVAVEVDAHTVERVVKQERVQLPQGAQHSLQIYAGQPYDRGDYPQVARARR